MREAGGGLAAEATFDLGTISSYHLTALPPSAPLLSSYYHSWQCRLVGHQVNVLTYAWYVHGACMRMHMHMNGRCMARYVGEHLHPPPLFRSAGCRCRYRLYLTYISPISSLYLQSAGAAKECGYGYLLGERSATHQLLQLDRTYAAALGSCSPMRWRLQPYVMEAATLCDGGCNPM